MSNSSYSFSRPFLYVLAAVMIGSIVGYFREGTIGGALVLAFAIGLGVALGILALAMWRRYS